MKTRRSCLSTKLLILLSMVFITFSMFTAVFAENVETTPTAGTSESLPRALTGDMQQSEMDLSNIPRKTSRYTSHETPPSTIKVALTGYANCSGWIDAGYPVNQVITVNFIDYVKDVLPNEWLKGWYADGYESLKAGAMAVKMFGWQKVNVGWRNYLPGSPDIVDNTCDQRYIQGSHDWRTDAAVDDTWTYRMRRNGQVFGIHYLAYQSQCESAGWADCMGQWESYYRARDNHENWQQILTYFYAPIEIDTFGCGSNLCGNVGGCTLQPGTYNLTCDIYVNSGASLHILPGATLNYNGHSFTVNGQLTWGP